MVPGGYRHCENCRHFYHGHDFWQNLDFNGCHRTGAETALNGLCGHWEPAEVETLTEMITKARRTKWAS